MEISLIKRVWKRISFIDLEIHALPITTLPF
jgi:hypothetical protein